MTDSGHTDRADAPNDAQTTSDADRARAHRDRVLGRPDEPVRGRRELPQEARRSADAEREAGEQAVLTVRPVGRGTRIARILVPIVLIVVWFAAAGIGGPYFGRIGEVSSNDPVSYLPSSAESTQVQELTTEFYGGEEIPAILVASKDDGSELTDQEIQEVADAVETTAEDLKDAGELSPPIPSEDGKALQVFVPLDQNGDPEAGVETLRKELGSAVDGITMHVTGPAGFSADLTEAFAGIDGLLLVVALAAVLVILLIVYRAVLLPLLVLASSMFALCVAVLANWHLANQGIFLLNGQVQGILFILVIGAATDYGLLLTARYREELELDADRFRALGRAWKGSVEPIIASGGTVIAGLLCLLLSDLESNRALGPVASVGILCAILAALTFLPAMLAVFGRIAYWPRIPRPRADEDGAAVMGRDGQTVRDVVGSHGVYGRVGALVARRPVRVWVGALAVLAVACVFVPQLKADGVGQSDLILTASDARDGQEVLGEHFPAGSGTPAQILAPEADMLDIAQQAADVDGVDSVAVVAQDDPAGSLRLQGGRLVGTIPGRPAAEPTVVDGKVLIQATLADAYDSPAAEQTVRELRQTLGDDVLVGGQTATTVDTNTASTHDRNLIIPIVLAVITVILMLLMRSLVAALLLLATTVLSFGSAMGVSALVFNHLFEFPGADPAVPLYGFVFLVALGIDYNIFLMTRVREESVRFGTHEGMVRGLAVTGGVITSAGIVLAATFAALFVIPILFLAQLAFIVAFGVLLDTFIVRTLLVPGLGLTIGRPLWWPLLLPADRARGRKDLLAKL